MCIVINFYTTNAIILRMIARDIIWHIMQGKAHEGSGFVEGEGEQDVVIFFLALSLLLSLIVLVVSITNHLPLSLRKT